MVSKVEFETIDTRPLELESIISHMTIIFEIRTIYRLHIKRKVDVRVTDKTVEIFYNHSRIASHRRLYGRKGQ